MASVPMSARLGRLRIDFEGEHPVRYLVERELAAVEDDGSADRSLSIWIGDRPPAVDGPSVKGSRLELTHSVIGFGDCLRLSLSVKHGKALYSVDVEPSLHQSNHARASIYLPATLQKWSLASSPLVRLMSRDASSLVDLAAKNVIYEIVDALVEYRLLTADSTLLHASALGRDGRAIAIASTGGVGKSTSLLAAMTLDGRLSYLADDMASIDSEGTIHRHPKKIQIYAYNTHGNPDLRRAVLSRMSRGRRLLWFARARVLGANQSRVRIRPEQLFGHERVVDAAALDSFVWLRSTPDQDMSIRQADRTVVARRCAIALVDELWDFNRLVNLGTLVSAAGMTTADLQTAIEAVVAAALEGVPCFEISVPRRSDPFVLARAVLSVSGW